MIMEKSESSEITDMISSGINHMKNINCQGSFRIFCNIWGGLCILEENRTMARVYLLDVINDIKFPNPKQQRKQCLKEKREAPIHLLLGHIKKSVVNKQESQLDQELT